MALVYSAVICNKRVPRGQPVHRYMNDLCTIKNKPKCLEVSNSYARQHAVFDGRRPGHENFMGQPFTKCYVSLKRRNKLNRKLLAVPPLPINEMDNNCSSNSRGASLMAASSRESNTPLEDNIARQLDALDSYFSKLQGDATEPSVSGLHENSAPNKVDHQRSMSGTKTDDVSRIKSELSSLDNYFDKLDPCAREPLSKSKLDLDQEISSPRRLKLRNKENSNERQGLMQRISGYIGRNNVKTDMSPLSCEPETYKELQTDEFSDFYLIGLFLAIDVAAFLFAMASPVSDPNFDQLSLPLLYGGKVNKLILDGEWWRLITPMFLHSGILHLSLSFWALLKFGPPVCKAYGPFTFFLMYIMGGLCANMASFLQTPELTVSGTGPVFAIIGAWLVYQFQNKDAVPEEKSDYLYLQAFAAIIWNFCIIDDPIQIDQWTNLAAAISGVLFGFLTCPTMQLNDSSSENNQEGTAIARSQADPLKSALIFIFFILILGPLVYEFPLDFDISDLENFIE